MADNWIAAECTFGGVRGWQVTDATAVSDVVVAPDLPALRVALGDALVVGCGFVGDSRMVPCTPLPDSLPKAGGAQLVPGLVDARLHSASGGAETRIAGFLADANDWDGVICVTGETHVWALVSAGEVVSFQGFDTGRLARVLALGKQVSGAAFDVAFSEVMSRPERFAAVMARGNLQADGTVGWGALIGAELAASRPFWLGQQVAVIGDDAGADAVGAALAAQGVPVERAGALVTLIAGLDAARRLGV